MATIAENLQTILDIKNNIKDAIIAKGVSVADSDGFATYPGKIESIEISGGTTSDVWVLTDDIKLGSSTFTEIPSFLDFSNLTNMEYMFYYCKALTSVSNIDTSKVTNMGSMFRECSSLTTISLLDTSKVSDMSFMFSGCETLTSLPLLDTSNVNSMSNMFNGCSSLTTIPLLDTSNVTIMRNMFDDCSSLTTIPLLDTSKVSDMSFMFYDCTSLTSLPLLDMGRVSSSSSLGYFFGSSNITSLTEVGGFKNLKVDWNDNNGLNRLPNLTYQSIMNVINNLYDFPANGSTETRTIKFNPNSIALLSDDDIAIATNKGWTIY